MSSGRPQAPSGELEPSAADRALSSRCKACLALLEIRLLDHFLIGGAKEPVSMAARGWVYPSRPRPTVSCRGMVCGILWAA